MVRFFKTTDNTKVIATTEKQCVTVFTADKSQNVFTYDFAYPKIVGEQLVETTEGEFTEQFDRISSRVIALLSKSGRGLRTLLPEAPQRINKQ